MCILISTTSHPDYPLILLSNRDEYFGRPTQLANKRTLPNGTELLSPLDLGRKEHGTWIGVTSLGKLAVLVNYCEPNMTVSEVSRGILPIDYLSSDLDDDTWYTSLEESLSKKVGVKTSNVLNLIGGFTLVYGKLDVDETTGRIKPLNIISNRGDRGKIHAEHDLRGDLHQQIALQKTFSVSNSLYYEPWKKVDLACNSLSELVESSVFKGFSGEQLVEACFDVLSKDTFPREPNNDYLKLPETMKSLRESVFIPPLNCSPTSASPMLYGTRTQTVILLHKSRKLHYYERDLHSINDEKIEIKEQSYLFDLSPASDIS